MKTCRLVALTYSNQSPTRWTYICDCPTVGHRLWSDLSVATSYYYSPLTTYLLLTACHLLLTTYCSLLTTYRSLLTTYHSILITDYVPPPPPLLHSLTISRRPPYRSPPNARSPPSAINHRGPPYRSPPNARSPPSAINHPPTSLHANPSRPTHPPSPIHRRNRRTRPLAGDNLYLSNLIVDFTQAR